MADCVQGTVREQHQARFTSGTVPESMRRAVSLRVGRSFNELHCSFADPKHKVWTVVLYRIIAGCVLILCILLECIYLLKCVSYVRALGQLAAGWNGCDDGSLLHV